MFKEKRYMYFFDLDQKHFYSIKLIACFFLLQQMLYGHMEVTSIKSHSQEKSVPHFTLRNYSAMTFMSQSSRRHYKHTYF